MPGQQLTKPQYALQKKVKLFSDLIFQLEGQRLIHITQVVYYFTHSIDIGYLVHWYFSTVLLPFEECSEDWSDCDKA